MNTHAQAPAFISFLLTTLALAGCGAAPAAPVTGTAVDLRALLSAPLGRDKPFVIRAAAEETSAAEIGKLGLRRARHPAIREYAAGMSDEHGSMRQELMDLAKRRGSFIPTSMSTNGSRQSELLQTRPISQFDRDFLVLQVQLQQSATMQLIDISRRAQDAEVRTWAAQAAGIWRRDEDYARRVHESIFIDTGMDDHSDTPQ